MKRQNIILSDAAVLRQRAEEKLKKQQTEKSLSLSEPDILKLIHELQVHQIELEMQNEELVLAKEKAEHAEEKYTELYDFAPSGYLSLSKAGEILELNFAAANMLGKVRSELIKKRFSQFVSPETLPVFTQFFKTVFTSKVKQTCEVIITSEGNLPIYVNIDGIVSGNDEFCLLTIVDNTERMNAENALCRSESIKNTMISNIGDVIVIIDQYGINQYKSPNIKTLFGWQPEELVGKSIWDNVHPDDVEAAKYFIATLAFEPNATGTTEIRYKCKDGNYVWIEITVANLLSDPDIHGFLGNYHDISERKQAENALGKSEERFNLAMNASNDGLFDWNLETNAIYYSPAGKKMLGYEDHELPNNFSVWENTTDPEDVKKSWELQQKLITKQIDRFVNEFKMKHKDGHWIDILSRAEAIFNSDGKAVRIVGTHTDITDRKQIETNLKIAKEKAEESDRLKSAFLANMSHEIRTPMNGILGFSELLKNPKLTGEKQQKYIRIIEKSGERMLNTINDIMDIAKIEAGQVEVIILELNISEQLDNLHSFFNPEASKKGIQLLLNNQLFNYNPIIKSDNNKLISILTNLLKNALKFCSTGTIEFGCIIKGKMLEFYVKDTGKGIPEERQLAIFDRFVQADIEDKQAIQGSGLGLAISKSYVEMLGGEIWVESEIGKGSTFFFTIPYHPVKELKHEKINNGSNDKLIKGIFLKILLAEDDSDSEMLIKIMLNDLSSEIITASTGTDAVRICQNNPDINLILMDIRLPGMDGYKATRKIREFNKDVIIIAQTAFALAGDREKAIEVGCNDYIAKPIKKAELLALTQKFFGK